MFVAFTVTYRFMHKGTPNIAYRTVTITFVLFSKVYLLITCDTFYRSAGVFDWGNDCIVVKCERDFPYT